VRARNFTDQAGDFARHLVRLARHLVILCPAYATVRFVDNQTVRQDLAVELFR
jgi:hypothetical protein